MFFDRWKNFAIITYSHGNVIFSRDFIFILLIILFVGTSNNLNNLNT